MDKDIQANRTIPGEDSDEHAVPGGGGTQTIQARGWGSGGVEQDPDLGGSLVLAPGLPRNQYFQLSGWCQSASSLRSGGNSNTGRPQEAAHTERPRV
jgi:hypothetical protein